jgi:hypothetical protein
MKREKLIKEIRRWCRKNGAEFALDKQGGKGSHYKVTVGARWTIIQSGEILPRHVETILEQLRVPSADIRR